MKVYYFDDFKPGDAFKSPARTITEADLVLFAGLTGDHNAAHTDEIYARNSPTGRRILHGVAGLSYAVGLEQRCGIKDGGGALLVLGLTWDYRLPIFVGDTIHVVEVVSHKRLTSKYPSHGVVNFDVRLKNQHDKVTQEGEWKVMYKVKDPS